ncbi:universal stress protein [Maribacter litopenaei]|uniref:Universal stress protein n=1 Tax=Maribacter litopenaei TaxID=2976127 RepID=A0ABY5Y5A5_9FLAO|nr:universal stress protein [Maribacter litopenaei]UWX53859.1 universal stress protein [Maribacter litopenaei]
MTILYATDCSKNSISTLQYAQKLALQLSAKLVVLYVYDIPPIAGKTIKTEEQIQRGLKKEKLQLLRSYCHENSVENIKNLTMFLTSEYGASITHTIMEYTLHLDCNLLIIGMKDEHSKRGVFSGNIANSLLRHINCKMMIVPNAFEFSAITSIVYATDFEEEDIKAIQQVLQVFKMQNLEIKVVHVDTNTNAKGKEQMEWFKEMVLEKVGDSTISFNVINAKTVPQGLRMFIGDENPNLIALLEREEPTIFKKLFHKDLIKTMESRIRIPILSINQKSLQ